MIHAGSGGKFGLFCVLVVGAALLFPVTARGAVATVPFQDDFDYPVLGPWWTSSGTAPGPLAGGWWYHLLNTCGPPSGAYHLVLDSSTVGTDNRNEITLTVDLAGKSSVCLAFLAKSFADTPHPLTPWAPYTDSKDFDGVVVSPDGVTWYPVLNLTENDGLTRSYTQFTVPLDAALAAWSISYTPAFRIRFNHFGSGQVVSVSGNSGIGIDAVSVYESPPPTRDFGDAPAPYPTLLVDNGARHEATGPTLGAARDVTVDGQPSDDASGDGADEDGVTFVEPLVPGRSAVLHVTASAPAKLGGWIDFNGNGSWVDAADHVCASLSLAAGENDVLVNVPAGAAVSDQVFARFRLSTAGGLSYNGAAADGEVEDYRVAIVPAAPVMNPEPPLTPGNANTVSWASVPQADSYYVECSQAADFGTVSQSSGWIPGVNHTFAGLSDLAQYFRVRAAGTVAGAEASWSQTEDAEFSLDTLSGTALYGGGEVSLQGPIVHTDSVGGANEAYKATATGTGRFNVFLPSQTVRLTGFSMLLSRETAMDVEFAVYSGGSAWNDPYDTKLFSRTVHPDAGMGFLAVEGLSLMLTSGTHYAVGLTWSGTASTYKAFFPVAGLSFGKNAARTQSLQHPGEPALTMTLPSVDPTGMCYYMGLTTDNASAYVASGEVVSPVITPAPWVAWRTLNYTAGTPTGTTVMVDILPATGNTPVAGWSDLVPGADLGQLSAMPVRLRARMSTSNSSVTPVLLDWGITWQAEADRLVQGAWSAAVMSTQDGLAPSVVSVTPTGPNPARTPTVRFLVQFSEAVTGVGLAAPFGDFAVRAGSVPGASIVAVTQAGNPSRYEVEVATGHSAGTIALDALIGGNIHDVSGNALAAGCASGVAYTLDYTPPAVANIARLDPSPTNAQVVRFGVTFSEAVTGVPVTAPFTGFSATGLTGTSVLSISGSGTAYTVSVQTGAWDGTVRLAVGTSGAVRDAAGWPLAVGQVSAAGYAMSHLRFTAIPAPLIMVTAGDRCAMAVAVAGGTGARTYQWHLDDVLLPGAADATLDIPRAGLDDVGRYHCEVTDAHETIQSPPTRLQVQAVMPAAGTAGRLLAAAALALAGVCGVRGRVTLRQLFRRLPS